MPQALHRTVLAAALAAAVALAASRAHVHEAAPADHPEAPCAVCQLRTAEPLAAVAPDLAPRLAPVEAAVVPAGLAPAPGAPLGAVPGQSPPARA